MEFFPKLGEVRRIAATGDYRVLPVSCEILSDFTTPIEALRILKNVSNHCYMLESAWADERWGRYTFLGFDPKLEITCTEGEMKAGNLRFPTQDPAACLRQILADYKSPRFDYLPPFTGGLVGYFSYDYLGYSEPSVRRTVTPSSSRMWTSCCLTRSSPSTRSARRSSSWPTCPWTTRRPATTRR